MFNVKKLENVFQAVKSRSCNFIFNYCVKKCTHSCLSVCCCGSRFVYLLRDSIFQVIYKLPDTVIDCCVIASLKVADGLGPGGPVSKRRRLTTEDGPVAAQCEVVVFVATKGGSLYAIPSPQSLSGEGDPAVNEKKVCLTSVSISDGNKVLSEPSIVAMVVCDLQLAVLSGGSSLILNVYTVETTATSSLNLLPTFRVILDSYFTSFGLANFRLHILLPSSYSDSVNCFEGSKTILISDSLFTRLFGAETNLVNSGVVLLSGCGGVVRWLPFRLSATGSESFPRLLYDHDDEVVNIVGLSAESLAIVGRSGSVFVFSTMSSPLLPVSGHRRVLGPVVCCERYGDGLLLYSTGDELYLADFCKEPSSSFASAVVCCALGIHDVVSTSVQKCAVIVATSCGRVSTLEIASADQPRIKLKQHSLSSSGNYHSTMRDLLTAIGKISEHQSTVHSKCRALDTVFEQLAFAGTLLSVIDNAPDDRLVPIECFINPEVSSNGRCDASIAVRLVNNCAFTFGAGWTSVVTLCCDSNDLTGCSVAMTSSISDKDAPFVAHNLEGFSHGMSETIVMSIDSQFFSSYLVSVNIMLVYNYYSSEKPMDALIIGLCQKSIHPLDFFRPVSTLDCRWSAETGFSQKCYALVPICRPHFMHNSGLMSNIELSTLKRELTVIEQSARQFVLVERVPQVAFQTCSQGAVNASRVLSCLLHGNGFLSDLSAAKIHLFSTRGDNVVIEVSSTDNDEFKVTLRGSNITLIISVHSTILYRIKKLLNGNSLELKRSSEKRNPRRTLEDQMEDLRLELNSPTSSCGCSKRVVELFESARNNEVF